MYSNLNLDRCVSWNGLREAAHGVLIITCFFCADGGRV